MVQRIQRINMALTFWDLMMTKESSLPLNADYLDDPVKGKLKYPKAGKVKKPNIFKRHKGKLLGTAAVLGAAGALKGLKSYSDKQRQKQLSRRF